MTRVRSPQLLKADANHGTNTGYSNGCRCERCRMAQSEYQRRRYAGTLPPKPDPVPLAPLLERLSSYVGCAVEQLSLDDIAEACGVDQRTALRWRQRGTVAMRQVDDIAVRLGWHPAAIWGADWYIRSVPEEAAA